MRRIATLCLFLAAAMAGCNLPEPTPVNIPTPVVPTCDTASLQQVTLDDPPMWGMVDSLEPTLSWTYPDPSCVPEGYAITLKTGPLFSDDLSGGTGNSSTSWGPGAALEPGKEYEWAVAPINGTTQGPDAGFHYFFTGPTCDTAALVAPTLLQPADGASFDETHDSLIWDYPQDCSPQGYRIDLSTDATFADTSLSGGTGNPSTRWGPGSPLSNCQTYYWRVAGINDTTLGPFSPSRSFVRDTGGACGPTMTPTPTAAAPTPVPGAGLGFIIDKNAFCRQGPGLVYKDITAVPAGEIVDILGRSQDSLWYYVFWKKFTVKCWVGAATGHANGDVSGVAVLAAPPTPTWTASPVPMRKLTPTWVPRKP